MTVLAPATPEELTALRSAAALYEKRQYEQAAGILAPLAEKGSARAAFSLGLMAMRGHGMPMSTDVAEKWWTFAAERGFPDAQYHLGLMHYQGLRGSRNAETVAKWWSRAAAAGQGDAMFGLGYMCRAGDGVPKDLKKSVALFTDAAAKGHPGAMLELGMMYKYGRYGVAKNTARGTELLQKAAATGMTEAARELERK